MIPPFRVYLFDVDGTLLDSAPDICGAVREVLAETSAAGVDDAFLKRYIGKHLFELFQDVLPGCSAPEMESLLARYRRVYPARGHRATRVYPGVVDGLRRLGGLKSTATTKGTPTLTALFEQFGLRGFFHHLQGTDGFPAKPAPDVIHKSLDHFRARPQECLFVGDSATDMAAGRAAGVNICAVRYGYGDVAEMAHYEPDYWIQDLGELCPAPAVTSKADT